MECDHLLVDDEVEYLYKGKSCCDDSYRAVKKIVTINRKERELKGLSIRVNKGDAVTIMGPNGSGKTTLLNVALEELIAAQVNGMSGIGY